MHTCSGKVYHPDKPNKDMDPNASSSDINLLTDYLILEILKTLEKIKPQMNTLGQRMDILEIERRDRGRNEDRQLNQRWEDKINKNYDQHENDGGTWRTLNWTYRTLTVA